VKSALETSACAFSLEKKPGRSAHTIQHSASDE
jgi:hypothetical protein